MYIPIILIIIMLWKVVLVSIMIKSCFLPIILIVLTPLFYEAETFRCKSFLIPCDEQTRQPLTMIVEWRGKVFEELRVACVAGGSGCTRETFCGEAVNSR